MASLWPRVFHAPLDAHTCCACALPAETPDYWYRGQKQFTWSWVNSIHVEWVDIFSSCSCPRPAVAAVPLFVVKQSRARFSSYTLLVLSHAAALCYRISWKQTQHCTPVGLSRGLLHPRVQKHMGLLTCTHNSAVSFFNFLLVQSSNVLKCLWIRAQPFICVSHPL